MCGTQKHTYARQNINIYFCLKIIVSAIKLVMDREISYIIYLFANLDFEMMTVAFRIFVLIRAV